MTSTRQWTARTRTTWAVSYRPSSSVIMRMWPHGRTTRKRLAEFKITDQGESGGESFLMDLNIISAKMRKKIFGFENATKGRKMFFIVTDNNGTNYLMGDKRRGALRASGDGATTGASSTARNQNTLHYTFTAPRKCVYEGDTEDILTVKAASEEP